ncbi:hypothetical protein [Ilumatobacter coccineus]|uniref:Uncharacterized protein n=1 Tax=Ilumatobacter coccineus (strain NBRC 103263 / KCTC 29153 / YM16-304) TaxID=1313172 RepID=A0A6C7EAC2_ILUCY|nr:hypothetical protein [Ilumatobacter coccineus]BAN02159.1 hypothetical protein YM304_18450 [Ilumatobacter coccineus YM16-304]
MSVDTNVKGKNLAPYRKLRHEKFQILITPQLIGMAESMRVVTKGGLSKKLKVEFQAVPGTDDGSCNVC